MISVLTQSGMRKIVVENDNLLKWRFCKQLRGLNPRTVNLLRFRIIVPILENSKIFREVALCQFLIDFYK